MKLSARQLFWVWWASCVGTIVLIVCSTIWSKNKVLFALLCLFIFAECFFGIWHGSQRRKEKRQKAMEELVQGRKENQNNVSASK